MTQHICYLNKYEYRFANTQYNHPLEKEEKRLVKNITKNNSNSNEQRIVLNDSSEINNNK